MKNKLIRIMPIIFSISMFAAGCQQSIEDTRCGKQCDEYFKQQHGQGMFDNREGAGTVSFKYHYNKKLNKCLILLDENGYKRSVDKLYRIKTLMDVNEKKKLGSFSDIIGLSTDCNVLEKKCNSEDQWDELINPYMKE